LLETNLERLPAAHPGAAARHRTDGDPQTTCGTAMERTATRS
jgi:hypothetical protein